MYLNTFGTGGTCSISSQNLSHPSEERWRARDRGQEIVWLDRLGLDIWNVQIRETTLFECKANYFPFSARQNFYEYHYFGGSRFRQVTSYCTVNTTVMSWWPSSIHAGWCCRCADHEDEENASAQLAGLRVLVTTSLSCPSKTLTLLKMN